MPTKKPILQSVVEIDLYEKFCEIANKEKRSKSQLTAIAIEEYVKNWEGQNGSINIEINESTVMNNKISIRK